MDVAGILLIFIGNNDITAESMKSNFVGLNNRSMGLKANQMSQHYMVVYSLY